MDIYYRRVTKPFSLSLPESLSTLKPQDSLFAYTAQVDEHSWELYYCEAGNKTDGKEEDENVK